MAANGTVSGAPAYLAANANKDDRHIILSGASGFAPGDALQLIEEDDSLITSDWALHTTGQIMRVGAVSGDTLFLESPLRRGYRLSEQARAVPLNMARNIGIERLRLVREDATVSQTSNIRFDLVADSWIQCVESYNANFGHIDLRRSMHVTVEGSYMQDGFAYGSGGKAYGVVLHSTTGDCLVTGNRFKHLRHSMLLQSGANGNVLSYNYSTGPHWTEVGPLPANSAGDLVLHGNYPYLNLFEGNDVAHIVIDDSHVANGPFNTVFRNRAHLYGIFMSNLPPSPQQNLIGNEVTNPNAIMGYYVINGWGHVEYGNNIRGQIIPAGTSSLPEASLYLSEGAAYYTASGSWPPIGPPNALNVHTIEARNLYGQGLLTDCEQEVISGIATGMAERRVNAYPSPTTGPVYLQWEDGLSPISLQVYNLAGKMVRDSAPGRSLDLTGLPAGFYHVRLAFSDGSWGTVAIAVLSKN